MSYYALVPNTSGLMAAVHTLNVRLMGSGTGTREPHLETPTLASLSVPLPDMNPALQPVGPPPGPGA